MQNTLIYLYTYMYFIHYTYRHRHNMIFTVNIILFELFTRRYTESIHLKLCRYIIVHRTSYMSILSISKRDMYTNTHLTMNYTALIAHCHNNKSIIIWGKKEIKESIYKTYRRPLFNLVVVD